MSIQGLASKQCQRNTILLDNASVRDLLNQLHTAWTPSDDCKTISRSFRFKDYYQTIAFVNALACIVHEQDHHPDLKVSYNHCDVYYSTHSVGGLSENDFICAARIDCLVAD